VLERDLVGVRVGYADRCLGNLYVAEKEGGHPFTADDRNMLEELAERVGISIEISRLNQSAQEAVRSRDVLLAVVAHDLRSPLSAISVSSAMLARKAPAEGDRRRGHKQVNIIKKATERMDRLIEDLLTASTIEAGRFTVSLKAEAPAAILNEAYELLEPVAAASQVSLAHDAAPALPLVLCDRERIIQVLGNLVQNAVKFTPSAGRVRMSAETDGAGVRWSVSDEGPGIPPSKVPLLFDRYWKGESSGRHGVGLGLYISRGIIESHGSKIQIETALGRGSTFSFTLPLAPKDGP
jgi:signal transduction histidine kinase